MRYQLITDMRNEVIRDTQSGQNIFFLATSGFGIRSSTIATAKKVVDFLNADAETQTEERHAPDKD